MTADTASDLGLAHPEAAVADRCAPLFAPQSIAVVGVSATRSDSWGRLTVDRLRNCGYEGQLTIVGRPVPALLDVRTVPRLSDLPAPPDLVVLATPAGAAPGLLREARERGARSAVVYASGFAESDSAGQALERELQHAAGDMPVLGPNCLGLVNHAAKVQISTTAYLDRERVQDGPVAVVTQSGALGFVLADKLERAGIGFTAYVSVGNEACVSAAEAGTHLLGRTEVEVLVLYLEGVSDAQGLRRLAQRARTSGKRVVALTVGSSDAGRRAALSHTAAVAGDHLLLSALCRQEGIVLAQDDDDLVEAVMNARRGTVLPPAPRFAVLTMSGGAGGVLADRLTALGARVPTLSPLTRERLTALDAVDASLANPVDLGGNFFRSLDRVSALLDVLDEDPETDAIVLYLTFGDRFPDAYRRIAALTARTRTPAWFVWACAPDGAIEALALPETVLSSIGALTRRLHGLLPGRPVPAGAPVRAGEPQPTARTLSELHAAPLLTAAGATHAPMIAAEDPQRLVDAVRAAGWSPPYVLKGDASDVPHRARQGLVHVGVTDAELFGVATVMAARLRAVSADPGRRLVAQPLLAHTTEIALGAIRDPLYGTALVLGAGGERAEDTTAPRRALLTAEDGSLDPAEAEALAAWAETELGAPAEATAAAVRALATVLREHPDVVEADVNPLCVRGDELVAVDALLTLN
ncbi:acetate--CoA ligase family protein [Streptomyces sp. NPDC048428]|uniref:acetate--CoA ligase family protein n=1 Tax=Streptomyces sp. NPDC048428 TaxID=3154503 RepID=UPI003443BDCF